MIGVHDAGWRDEIEFSYLQGRSNGCINMIRRDIEKLYSEVLDPIQILIKN